MIRRVSVDWGLATVAVGVPYLLVAWVSMLMSPPPEHIALFWPASGIAAGTLIATGSGTRSEGGGPGIDPRLPFALGIFIASFIANQAARSNVGASLVISACNAGECLMVSAIVARLAPRAGGFGKLRGVAVFMGAAVFTTALVAIPAAVALREFGVSPSPLLQLWFVWMKSDAMGFITMAPLFITLGTRLRPRLTRWQVAEGVLVLLLMIAAAIAALALPPDDIGWKVVLPAALLLPLLLWLATRTSPVFMAAAICIYALLVTAMVWSGHGWLGDAATPLATRVMTGQIAMLTFAVCGLSLTAVMTELVETARALHTSEQRLRLSLDAGSTYAFDFDPATGRGHRVGALAQRLGLAARGQLREYDQRLHPEDRERFRRCMRNLSPAEPTFSDRFRLIATDGTEVVVGHRTEAIFDAGGRITRILGTCTDVTSREQVLERLRDTEGRLLLALNAGGVYAFDFDLVSGRVHRFGQLIERLDLPPVGGIDDYLALFAPEDRARFERQLAGLSPSAPSFIGRYHLHLPDGATLIVVHRAQSTFDSDGRPLRSVGTVADTTERYLAVQALRESEERLHRALQLGRVIAFDWDPATGRSRRSDNAAEILGVSEQQAQMTNAEFMRCVHPADREDVAREIARLSPEVPSTTNQFRFVRTDRHVVWLEVNRGGVFDRNGRLTRISGLTRDITERKLAQEQQDRLIGELNHRVKNVLTLVGVVIKRSREGEPSLADFVQALEGRIGSMTRTHERLSLNKWDGVDLATLVADELTPYRTGDNTEITGPDILLAPHAAQTMAMTLHELATNAAKYGALSRPSGRVEIGWRCERRNQAASAEKEVLCIEWREHTTWPIDPHPTASFGVTTIRELARFELDAEVDVGFAPDGARCSIVIPMSELAPRTRPSVAFVADTTGTPLSEPTGRQPAP